MSFVANASIRTRELVVEVGFNEISTEVRHREGHKVLTVRPDHRKPAPSLA